ncbi:hypothetical protein GH714_023432 [Hevea brasiliensis]|uniref:Endonuclease/exonuclease/phosphatase domain-containing protein n=1 Tax=Hevea brasiliensis TaxID=3981 RepID=A0A6A6N3T0_HEVBR|nr:hypothetical protein GH714_023432 [Hevea brasiliensis]
MRLDVSFAVNKLCQFMHSPTVAHWQVVKRLLHYLQHMKSYGLCVSKDSSLEMQCFTDSDWGGDVDDHRSTSGYAISRPFNNSVMGRELCIVELEVQPNKHLVVDTCHLESPCPAPPTWDQMFSKERVDQAKEAINVLMKNANVIFGGDMNWDNKLDGHFPSPDGWIDAWAELIPGEDGWTYDTKSNQMLSGNRTLQKRLDRFICNLHDFRISKIDMIGTEAMPGLSHIKEKKVRKEVKMLELPVFPSDHYGLLLTISAQ